MRKVYKILVTGPFDSGKTTFISAISDIEVVSTERGTRVGKRNCDTTVAMDFGRIALKGGYVLHLYGTPGLERFEFMLEILSEGMLGYVVLVDGTRPSAFEQGLYLIESFKKRLDVPLVVGLTRPDRRNCMGVSEAEKRLGRGDLDVIACDARNIVDVKTVLVALLDKVKQQEEAVEGVG